MEKSEGGAFPPKITPSETVEQQNQQLTSLSTDLPEKKLARQLDFTRYTAAITVSESAAAASPKEHPQLLPAVPKPNQSQALNPFRLSVAQLQPSLPLMLAVQQTSEPSAPHTSTRHMKHEFSPRLGQRPNPVEAKDGTPKKPKQCSCKHAKCLKLYCDCFVAGIYCDNCNCVNCHNNAANEVSRAKAVEAILERNPEAFRPKIASSPLAVKYSEDNDVIMRVDTSAQSGDVIMRMMARNSMSEKLAEDIDAAVKRISDSAYEIALSHIRNNREAMDKIVEVLLEKETLSGAEFRAILSEFAEIPAENRVPPSFVQSSVAV